MTNLGDRIIVLIDMDCFFCQVESRLQPDLQGKPLAVVQYNQWRSGGIIAVNYEARDFGVTRHMRGDEAKEKCPDIALVSVPSLRGKADTSKYRAAGREVIDVLKKHCTIIERASVDEAYLDITELVDKRISSNSSSRQELIDSLASSFVVGYCDDESNDEEQRRDGVEKWLAEAYADLGDDQARKLAVAGTIVEELRAEIYAISKFRCSAGISYNKILAKLACGIHKPNRQTILPTSAVPSLYATLPVKKVRNLGGKFGNIVMESLGCNVMADLMRYSLQDLQKRFDEKTGSWLYNIARGIDNEPVITRLVCKSIGASKNFPGKQAIVKLEVLKHWVNELSLDVSDRLEQDLEENQRRATTLTVSFQYYEDRKVISQSRSCPLKSYKAERIASQCVELITKSTQKPIANIGIATGKFVAAKGSGNFVNFFKSGGVSSKPEDSSTQVSIEKKILSKTNETSLKSETKVSVDSRSSNCDDSNSSKAKNVEISEKPKKIVDSFFAKLAENRKEDKNIIEPVSSSTAREFYDSDDSNPSRNENIEISEKPKKMVESFFAKLAENRKEDNNIIKPVSSSAAREFYDSDDSNPSRNENVDISEKPKKFVESFFGKLAQNSEEDTKSNEPISPSTAILGSAQFKKALNRENIKNSFFMNFLKDAKPEMNLDSSKMTSRHFVEEEKIVERPATPVESPEKRRYSNENNEAQKNEKIGENDLLAQLQEIFPDLDNIDRSVVQLLPIELQRAANSYLKTKTVKKVQTVKKVRKTGSKNGKSKGATSANSLQNFFVKTLPNTRDNSDFRKCTECNQMIKIEKYEQHKDFHVAQNLQREINRNNWTNERTVKSPDESNSLKRRLPDESSGPNSKKTKSISSFFSI